MDHGHEGCGLGSCVNPEFLEAVPTTVNSQRAAALTHHGDRYAYEEPF